MAQSDDDEEDEVEEEEETLVDCGFFVYIVYHTFLRLSSFYNTHI